VLTDAPTGPGCWHHWSLHNDRECGRRLHVQTGDVRADSAGAAGADYEDGRPGILAG